MSGALSRLAAAQVLMTVLDERRTLDDVLGKTESFDALSGPDRGFARAMVSAALSHLGRIDAGLAPFLDRPLETAPPPSQALLRIGAAQAWVLGTPDHAVVGETVAAAKIWHRAQRATGFLNAVLRKVVADASGFETAPALQVWPDWLAAMMVDGLGAPGATSLALAQTEEPDLYITPRSGLAGPLAARLGGAIVAGHSVKIDTQPVETLPGYEAGDWWVQDVAAALPARLLAAKAGETVLDICAAPGGKTMQLAATGASVTALDRSKPRLKRLKQNLWRTGFHGTVETVLTDAERWRPPALVDAVLLDAPCSALGTLRRHPEGAWIKTEEEVKRFPGIQERLLAAAAEMLKPGGRLIYCVCSPLPHEGIEIVERALHGAGLRRHGFIGDEIEGFEASLTPAGDLLTLPGGHFRHDAFYIARLIRE